jgi:phage-related protein
VQEFVDALDVPARSDVRRLQYLLQQYGHELSMPYAKPIGDGLWELRRTGRPQIRILYGFCRGDAVLVHAIKKQRSALLRKDIEIARKRLNDILRVT